LATWKSSNSASVRHFGGLKMKFLNGRVTLDPQVSSIHKTSVRPFGGPTMRFFKGHEILGWNIQPKFWRPDKEILQSSWDPRSTRI
jgi:hypothetical protein